MVISVSEVGALHLCPGPFISPYNPSVNMLAEFVSKILTKSVGLSYIAV